MKFSEKVLSQGYFEPPQLKPKNWIPMRIGKSKIKAGFGYKRAFRRRNFANKKVYCPNCDMEFTEYLPRHAAQTFCPFCRSIIFI